MEPESLENTKVTKMTEESNVINATLEMQHQMLINTEYVLKLQVMTGDIPIYYYTRVIFEDNLHTKGYLDFAMGFYEKTLTGTDLDTLAAYIEPDETGNNAALPMWTSTVPWNQISWGDLGPTGVL